MDRPPAQRFEDLVVWQKGHALVLGVYNLSRSFPRHETFGLTSQLRRASVSVAANIAEGFKKRSRADKARYLNIAQCSLEEARCYLILSRDLAYHAESCIFEQLEEVSRLLDSYTRRVLPNRDVF